MNLRTILPVLALAACSEYGINPEIADEGGSLPVEDTAPPADTAVLPESGVPVAVCDVSPNPVTPPFEAATWTGADSYDPDDIPITDYNWRLTSAPSGSAVSMPDGQANRPGFTPDLAGDYVGTLIVTNADGVSSEPCEVTLASTPAQDLWVEMFWAQNNDDMDLHLVRSTGNLNSSKDCYYMNCTTGTGLDWGTSGDVADNPRLDLDDIPQTGPENINIAEPEATTYTVAVHDYPGTVYQGANDVTVNVYLSGSLVWSDTRTMTGEDDVEYFAEIDWTTGTVTPQ
jgi:hypothetical protein